ncbi:hypothetical protein [Konateibacter massiliensis]|uniref:hypothetical protein n=1 Tax=Konateibacter massiliensis TaxID=2002841 RepID=UPI000C14CB8F|nr:hypothetical protein [Konateibacter massiliensis]
MKQKIIVSVIAAMLMTGAIGITSYAEATFNFNFSYSSNAQYSAKGYKNNLIPTVTVVAQESNLSSTKNINMTLVATDYSAITGVKTLGTSKSCRFTTFYEGYLYLKGSPNATGVYANGVWTTP